MMFQAIALFLDLLIAATVALAGGAKTKMPTRWSLILLAVFCAVWSLADGLYQRTGLASFLPLIAAAIYLAAMLAAAAQLTYVVSQINRENWMSRQSLLWLAVMPALT